MVSLHTLLTPLAPKRSSSAGSPTAADLFFGQSLPEGALSDWVCCSVSLTCSGAHAAAVALPLATLIPAASLLQCLINFAMALAEMKQQRLDAPSASMVLVNLFQLLYVLDGLWNEVRQRSEAGVSVKDVLFNGCPLRRPS